ncbi:MAG: flagellar motor protein MotD [Pseudomonadota bacterium]|uniref:flagellar motor protein MotD n=1 Tax=Thermithiobacillus tepidarius TaxID=929 RepID=UPI000427D760|nr:flagellar motor protein MotD [Thermithiobacillus tepidarius]
MARKKKHEEHENHERWLVSYADFITLLFAFFVVMYALSSINEGKYRILSESLVAAFKESPRSIQPIQVGPQSPNGKTPTPQGSLTSQTPINVGTPVKADASGIMDRIAQEMQKALGELIKTGKVRITRSARGIVVDINANFLFASGRAALTPDALPLLNKVAEILATFPNEIQVEGFTDNQPIHTVEFPSNWELSAARASTVIRLLASQGVEPGRMVAAGYGEYHPVAPNDSELNRAKNRRVSIVILAPNKRSKIGGTPLIELPDKAI